MADGRSVKNCPVVTKFYPALLLGALRRPHTAVAFAAGILTGALLPDRLEQALWQRLLG